MSHTLNASLLFFLCMTDAGERFERHRDSLWRESVRIVQRLDCEHAFHFSLLDVHVSSRDSLFSKKRRKTSPWMMMWKRERESNGITENKEVDDRSP